jgi:5S rRNA maturation endonuclease (ribonuclease M5)
MTTRWERQHEALEELKAILTEKHEDVELVLVEGHRDVEAIKKLGAFMPVELSSHTGKTEHDIVADLSRKTREILILTDFDEEGRSKAKRLSQLLDAEGVNVRRELRRKFGRFMGVLGVKTIESLDDICSDNLSLKQSRARVRSLNLRAIRNKENIEND